jgi:cytochrome bd-type quinol oxidase subunit 2
METAGYFALIIVGSLLALAGLVLAYWTYHWSSRQHQRTARVRMSIAALTSGVGLALILVAIYAWFGSGLPETVRSVLLVVSFASVFVVIVATAILINLLASD